MSFTGWQLDGDDRDKLLGIFPPAYPDIIADHVTLAMGIHALPDNVEASVVGLADDGEGVQALLLSVNGTTLRPDGKIYHITWSIDRSIGRKPVDSNKVIASGFKSVDGISINLIPKVFL